MAPVPLPADDVLRTVVAVFLDSPHGLRCVCRTCRDAVPREPAHHTALRCVTTRVARATFRTGRTSRWDLSTTCAACPSERHVVIDLTASFPCMLTAGPYCVPCERALYGDPLPLRI